MMNYQEFEDKKFKKEFCEDFSVKEKLEWESVKDRVVFQLVGKEQKGKWNTNVPIEKEKDMFIVYRILQEKEEQGNIQVTNEMRY